MLIRAPKQKITHTHTPLDLDRLDFLHREIDWVTKHFYYLMNNNPA